MRHEFEFRFDEPFVRAALRRDLMWKGHVLAALVLLIPGGFRIRRRGLRRM